MANYSVIHIQNKEIRNVLLESDLEMSLTRVHQIVAGHHFDAVTDDIRVFDADGMEVFSYKKEECDAVGEDAFVAVYVEAGIVTNSMPFDNMLLGNKWLQNMARNRNFDDRSDKAAIYNKNKEVFSLSRMIKKISK